MQGLFFDEPLVKRKDARLRPLPPTPNTGWKPPTEFPNLSAAKTIAFDTETKDLRLSDNGPGWARKDSHIVGISIAAEAHDGKRGAWYFPIRHEVEPHLNMDVNNVLRFAEHSLNTHVDKVGANLTYDIGNLKAEGVTVGGRLFDVQFAEALIDSNARVSLDTLARKYLMTGKVTEVLYDWIRQAYPNTKETFLRREIYRSPPTLVGTYAEADAWQPLDIYRQQERILYNEGLSHVFRLECDLIPLMVAMRMRGVRVDLDKAHQMFDELSLETIDLYEQVKKDYNWSLASTDSRQLGPFFENLGITIPRTDDGNYSVKKEWLASLHHPAADLVGNIREHEKICGTFLNGYVFKQHVMKGNEGAFLFPQFHQLKGDANGTMVGRFACVAAHTEINTQNGSKRIDRVQPGDRVLTHKGRYRRVLRTWVKGEEPMLSLKLDNGEVLTCTIAHKLLSSGGEWVTVEKIADEYFKNMGVTARQYCESHGFLPRQEFDDCAGHRNSFSDNDTQCVSCPTHEYAGSGAESIGGSSLLLLENGRSEPHAWENGRSAPQLDWREKRLQGVSDNRTQRQASVCSQIENGASLVDKRTTGLLSCAPHRRQPLEQRIGQPSSCDASGAQNNSFDAGTGQQIVAIEEINFAGCFLVYDITVEGDESYAACGVYSHNSSMPNLQNIPSRTKLGKKVRECFVPDEGHHCWRKFDFSQVHYRLLAHFAVGLGSDDLRASYTDDPKTDYHMAVYSRVAPFMGWSLTDEEEIKIKRRPIKNVNFGLLYGQSAKSLAYKAGFTDAQATEFFEAYHKGAPYVKPTMEAIGQEVQQYGYVTTLLGRRIRFEEWEPVRKNWDEPELPLLYDAAIAKWGAGIRRAFEYRGVNYKFQGSEPDIMKTAMRNLWNSGVFDYVGVPSITVHDELDWTVADDSAQTREAFDYVQREMQEAVKLRIPVFVDESNGPSWGKAD